MRVDLISSFEHLCELQSEWATLLDSLSGATPFQTAEWQLTWWKHFGSGTLQTLAFRDGNRLVGLLPIFRHEWDGRQQLTLIGSGISDYLDPPMVPAFAQQIVSEGAARLIADQTWDVCNWQDLSTTTPLQSLSEVAQLRVTSQADTVCSAVPLTEDFEGYWRRRSPDHRRNIARYGRKAEAEGAVQFRVDGQANALLLDALIDLHGARWRKQGESGTIVANRSAAFLRDFAEQLSRVGALQLFSLTWNSRVVAVIFGMARADVLYGYLSAFDPELEEFGFGRNLLFQALRYAAQQGYRCWNFLRGEEPYKASWGALPIDKCRLLITKSPYRAR